ncbi:glycoside hydrolase family 113 [Bdellovibrio sp. HCB2-146]|uniref:glycoside hydrolase family 113 n=1 Tax=Bdellovibrio sp. HCB2-146 TaxID=3394362 RepID=UPI0039BC4A0B
MKQKLFCLWLGILLFSSSVFAVDPGIHLVTYQYYGFRVDETDQGLRMRRLLGKIKDLGIKTLIFNFRGRMVTGKSSDIDSMTPMEFRNLEEWHLKETILLAKRMGFNVAIRPILLVVGPNWEFPYEENGITWWHGNIKPENPAAWFEKYFAFHERYMRVAKEAGVSWYSIGAEMHSMTSGFGDRDSHWRHGFPEEWVKFITRARELMGPGVKITYGANYTDQYILEDGVRTWGGEFAQWRHDISFLARTPEDIRHQKNMRELWKSLDFIGLDFYRALGTLRDTYPKDYKELVEKLSDFSGSHMNHLYGMWQNIIEMTGSWRPLALQEIGYRSVEKCFVAPYLYEDDKTPINYIHQAAAWDALLGSLTSQRSDMAWMNGIGIWQVLVDDNSDENINGGFSPLGKEITTKTLQKYFLLSNTNN